MVASRSVMVRPLAPKSQAAWKPSVARRHTDFVVRDRTEDDGAGRSTETINDHGFARFISRTSRSQATPFSKVIQIGRYCRFPGGHFLQKSFSLQPTGRRISMKESDKFRENAANCAMLAKDAKHGPARIRYKRMETAWLSLADEQDWLDGEVPPENIAADYDIQKTPPV